MSWEKILVIEDEKELADLYSERLKSRGYDPVIAYDGVEGLEKLKEIKPALILLDISMPHMNGVEFYQRICGADNKPKYPVLVITARVNLEKLFRDYYVDGFITKPFEGRELLNEIEVILRKQSCRKKDGSPRKIIIVDDDKKSLNDISSVFSNTGYSTDVAESGVEGIDKMMACPPDLALISLGLADLSGDLVVVRLQHMCKTKDVNFVLYVRKNFKHDKSILEKFSNKTGIKLMCEYSHPYELLDAVIDVFRGSEHG